MSDHIGFGRQSTPGPLTASAVFYPVVTSTQEMCEICGRIEERDRMHQAGWDGDPDGTGGLVYVCDAAHPPA